ncbi:MAG: glycosyltransferase family 39 protein [Pseudomonadota bacterium]
MSGLLDRIDAVGQSALTWVSGGLLRQAFALVVLTVLLFLPGQASLPVTDRDEGRYVQASKQMMETGDYVDIRFQDGPRWKKPVGIYWLQTAAAHTAGTDDASEIWAYRIPSLIGALGAVALTIWGLMPLIGRRAGTLAGLMLGSSILLVGEAHIAKTDAALLLTIVAAQGALARMWLKEVRRFDLTHTVLWVALAVGVLIKGPIILMVTGLSLLWLCIVDRSIDTLRLTRPLIGVPLFLIIAAPWFIAIGIQTDWAFYVESIGNDLLGKVGTGAEAHWGPPGYYLATIWFSFWPWTPLFVLALPWLWSDRRSDAMRFLTAWAVPYWAVFAITATKLPHYMLPILPALAGMLAHWMTHGPVTEMRYRWARWGAAILFTLGALIYCGIVIAALFVLEGRVPPMTMAIGLLCLGLSGVAALLLVRQRLFAFATVALVTMAVLTPALLERTLPSLKSLFISPRMVAAHDAWTSCAPQDLITVGYHEPSLVFLAGTDTRLIWPEEAVALLQSDPEVRIFFETPRRGTLESITEDVGHPLTVLEAVHGLNYNRGDPADILLLTRSDGRLATECARN